MERWLRAPGARGARVGVVVLAVLACASAAPAARLGFTLAGVALTGDGDPLGGAFSEARSPAFVAARQVSFAGTTGGLFTVDAGDTLTALATAGTPSPIGGIFGGFGLPAMNAAGVVAFQATVRGGSAAQGLFRREGGLLAAVVVAGDAAPGGGTFTSFGRQPSIGDAGTVAFAATAGGQPGLFFWSAGALSRIARAGDPAPCGGIFARFGAAGRGPVVNAAGEVVFQAQVTGGGEGVFRFASGAIAPVACAGDPTPIGGTFQRLGTRPAINNAGEVAFQAEVALPGATAQGLFLSSAVLCPPRGLCPVAVAGDAAPGGDTFRSFARNGVPGFNDATMIVFHADLADGTDAAFLFAAGELTRIAHAGEPCSLGGAIESIDPVMSLGPTGTLALRAECTGDGGIFTCPLGGVLSARALKSRASLLGTGLDFANPGAASAAEEVVFAGTRAAVFAATCRRAACSAAAAVAAPLAAVPALPGETIGTILPETVVASERTAAFVARTLGAVRREGLFLVQRGAIRPLALVGDAAPGSAGAFSAFTMPAGALGDGGPARPAVDRQSVAFVADVTDGGTTTTGVFALRRGTLASVAHEGGAAGGVDTFASFTVPSVSGNAVAFGAVTTGAECVFLSPRPGAPVERVLCLGDAAPAVGGALARFVGPPLISRGRMAVRAEVAGGARAECIFLRERRTTAFGKVVCAGDPTPTGKTLVTLTGAGFEGVPPLALSGRGVATFATDSDGVEGIYYFRLGVTVAVVQVGGTVPAGAFALFTDPVLSLRGRRLVFGAEFGDGGTGVFFARPGLTLGAGRAN
jgi:hypothetical protein